MSEQIEFKGLCGDGCLQWDISGDYACHNGCDIVADLDDEPAWDQPWDDFY